MGLGLQGSFGNDAMAGEIRARIVAQLKAQQDAQEMALKFRASDRQDRQLDQTDQYRNDNLERQKVNDAALAADREDDNNRALNDQVAPGTFFEPQNPLVGRLQKVGGVQAQEERPKVDVGPLLPGDTGAELKRGFLKVASQKQTVDASNKADKDADNARQAKRDSDADRHAKEMERIGLLTAGSNAQNHELTNQINELKLQAQRDKMDREAADRTTKADNSRQSTQTALDLVDRLAGKEDGTTKEHPGLAKSSGIISSRTAFLSQDATDANAIRDQLVATLTLPNLGTLKGPMSDKDVLFVKQLATRLANHDMSDGETRAALREARTFLKSKSDGQQPHATQSGAKADPLGIR